MYQSVTNVASRRASSGELSKWRRANVDPELLYDTVPARIPSLTQDAWRSECDEIVKLRPPSEADLEAMRLRRAIAGRCMEDVVAATEVTSVGP